MNEDKIYKILDLIALKKNIDFNDENQLIKLANCYDAEIRSFVAELLVLANSDRAEKVLIKLCKDKDELVRINACDSLSAFATKETYKQLLKCILNDESLLVKKYALLSLIDVMKEIDVDKEELKNFFLNIAKKTEPSIQAVCFKGMYILGYKDYLKNINNLLKSENYQDRCTVVNILKDIISDNNRNSIISILINAKKTEKSQAVLSTIENALKNIK